MKSLLIIVLVVTGAVTDAFGADVPGSSDHPLVTRYPGSTLIGYFKRDWDQTTFPLSGETGDNETLKKAVTVEGQVTRLYYLGPVGRSPLEVFRSYQQAFVKAGLKQRFACDVNCGRLYFHWRFGPVREATRWTRDDLHSAQDPSRRWNIGDAIAEDGRGVYGTLAQGGREIHVFVYTSIAGYSETNAAATIIEIAEPKAMESDQVSVDAAALSKGLVAEGKVTLKGIYFETGKALLKPESDPQLTEMAKLLGAQPKLTVFVVGHTDNQGGFESNLLLSQQRAAAVRSALVTRFKIAEARVTAYGVANVAPVASNATDSGRALNRRVELVLK